MERKKINLSRNTEKYLEKAENAGGGQLLRNDTLDCGNLRVKKNNSKEENSGTHLGKWKKRFMN